MSIEKAIEKLQDGIEQADEPEATVMRDVLSLLQAKPEPSQSKSIGVTGNMKVEMETKKINQSEFRRFKTEFLRWVKIFGLTNYRIDYSIENLENNFAEIHINEEGKVALVILSKELKNKRTIDNFRGTEHHARHEAIHLLIHRLLDLARARYINPMELEEEDESLVRKIEFALDNHNG
jgi:hypothetical protein